MEYLEMFLTHILKTLAAFSETGIPEIPLEAMPGMILEYVQYFFLKELPLYIAYFLLPLL